MRYLHKREAKMVSHRLKLENLECFRAYQNNDQNHKQLFKWIVIQ